jgi:DNA-binding transcriptional LysR family regulator
MLGGFAVWPLPLRRKAPPLEFIEAFVAAARTGSFRAAADKLALSPSAFSRRIRNLEEFLHAPLFDRSQSSARLTPAGQQYLQAIGPAMDALFRATLDFRGEQPAGVLRIRAPHSFAISWLLQRTASFMALNPDIEVEVTIGRGLDELRAGKVDAVIAIGPNEPHGFPQDRLIELEAAVVAAPTLLRGRTPPRHPQELVGHHVLCEEHAPRLWYTWLSAAGLDATGSWSFTCHETLLMMYEAAAAGLGVTLGLPLFMEKYFDDGRLQACFSLKQPIDYWYSMVYASEAISRRSDMRRFSRWLHGEIARSQQHFADAVARAGGLEHASVPSVPLPSTRVAQNPAHRRA